MRIGFSLVSALAITLAACSPSAEEAAIEPAIDAADVVYWGGAIYTANDEQPQVTAVATQDGRITFAGDEADAELLIGPETRIVDLNGGAMYPGFTDSHVHVFGVGQRERTLNLDSVASIEDLVARVAETVEGAEPGQVVYGRGWIETHYPEARFPNRDDLDAVSPDNPVVLIRADGHALVANSAALEAGGITRDSAAPEGGEILFDEAGEPTGMLIDTAMYPVTALVAAPTGQERADIYAEGAARLASLGWAGGHDMSVPYSDVEMIEGVAEAGHLAIRVYVSVNPDGYAALSQEVPRIAADGRVITRAVKIYMDGALGSRGAALLSPYSDRPETSGLTIAEEDQTIGLFTEALRSGVQMNVHAIGDRGNRLLLDWVEEALAHVPEEERARIDHRWRDEHTQIVEPSDMPRFAELGVIASMQPSHAIGDLHFAPARLGEERLEGAYAWQTLLDNGARLTGGSDAPVEQGDPRIEFYATVARADLEGFQGENWHPEEALSRDDALKLFTLWPAYASFREDELGSIEVGKRADFTIFSDDIMTIEPMEILSVTPWMTVVGGEAVYEHEASFHRSGE
ncbi:amidohydrolase [Maricaulis sp.]|uniref:amidohydrolase n=1 Tax=Maricaulis sp. TaxID=1486257 RepID=UPI00261F2ECE|nr:amidohydrolase [Maricaulis sp.]